MELKYERVKIASIISLIIIVTLYCALKIYNNNNEYEDTDIIINGLEKYTNEEQYISESVIHYNDDFTTHESGNFFQDSENVVKYIFSLAIQGKVEEFFLQFDPNIIVGDFENIEKMKSDQEVYFNTLTKNKTLTNIKIKNIDPILLKQQYLVKVLLIYSNSESEYVNFTLGKFGDDHSHSLQFYITSSIHEILKNMQP